MKNGDVTAKFIYPVQGPDSNLAAFDVNDTDADKHLSSKKGVRLSQRGKGSVDANDTEQLQPQRFANVEAAYAP